MVVDDVVAITFIDGQPEVELGPKVEAAVNTGMAIVDRPVWYVQYW